MATKPVTRSLGAGQLEVLADNGAHYRAHVVDIYHPTDQFVVNDQLPPDCPPDQPSVIVRFDGDWRPQEAVTLDRVRLPPIITSGDKTASGPPEHEFKEGSKVEILCIGKEGDGPAWWKSTVFMVKGDFFVVEDTSQSAQCKYNEQNNSEIVTKDRIRPINTNKYLTDNPFFKFMVEVPVDLLNADGQAIKQNETHRLFRKALKLFTINFDERHNRLICIGIAEKRKAYCFERTVKWAQMLVDMHWRALRNEFDLKCQINSLRLQHNHLEEIMKKGEDLYEVLVKVEDHLMGYAIGFKGSNIDRALKVAGVKSVDRVPVDKSENIFKVTATNPKAICAAKEIIQIMEEVVKVPREIVSHVIGKHGQLVQEVTDKSGLIIINVKGDEPDHTSEKYVPFHLIGTREAINNAKILLDFHMSCVKENLEIDKELAAKKNAIRRTASQGTVELRMN